MLLLDHIEKNYCIDKNRIYITGISMGGFGTWMCLNEAAKRFTAAAPICGGAKPEWAEKLTEIPIWNFHGNKDKVVPFLKSQNIVEAVKKAGGKKIIFTIYEGGEHDVWTRTYDNQLLYDWLFSHNKK
jgi:predicted peptidase